MLRSTSSDSLPPDQAELEGDYHPARTEDPRAPDKKNTMRIHQHPRYQDREPSPTRTIIPVPVPGGCLMSDVNKEYYHPPRCSSACCLHSLTECPRHQDLLLRHLRHILELPPAKRILTIQIILSPHITLSWELIVTLSSFSSCGKLCITVCLYRLKIWNVKVGRNIF